MIGCVDVHYNGQTGGAALVLFEDWASSTAVVQCSVKIDCPNSYEPGQFYKRELPCLLAVLDVAPCEPSILVIDGYVWLGTAEDGSNRGGLGAHLFDALNHRVVIIGAAKTLFMDSGAVPICRGTSKRPLFISAAGLDSNIAAECIRRMHGMYRLPTMVKLADQLARDTVDS